MPKKAGQPRICGPHLKYDKLKIVGYEKPKSGRSQDWDAEIPDLHGAPTARDRDESKDRRLCAAVESDAQSGAIAGRRLAMCESDGIDPDTRSELLIDDFTVAAGAKALAAVDVDLDAYKAYLDDPALSDAQKDQIVDALWKIIVCFVDLGFGMSPLERACGKLEETAGEGSAQASDVIDCEASTLTKRFKSFAARQSPRKEEEDSWKMQSKIRLLPPSL